MPWHCEYGEGKLNIMSAYIELNPTDEEYDRFVAENPFGRYYQTTTYAKTKRTQRFVRHRCVLLEIAGGGGYSK